MKTLKFLAIIIGTSVGAMLVGTLLNSLISMVFDCAFEDIQNSAIWMLYFLLDLVTTISLLVEYNEPITEIPKPYKPYSEVEHLDSTLKVSKDNTITIRKVKDSWNREEVVELLSKHFVDAGSKIGLGQDVTKFTKKWIEENL